MSFAKPKAVSIPPLPFRAPQCVDFSDPVEMSDLLSRPGTVQIEYRPVKAGAPFRSVLSIAKTERLRIIANASSQVHHACSSSNAPKAILLIPFVGHSLSHCDGRPVAWGGGQAAFLPPAASHGESSPRSAVSIELNSLPLQALARTMLGETAPSAPDERLDLTTPRAVSLDVADVQFGQIFRHYMDMLNAMGGDVKRMQRSGLEDMILRSAIMLLHPEHFFGDRAARHADGKLDDVCGYICANLDARITLTDLEALSGLSARSLQYQFRTVFGRTPMQWVTDQRLDAVREKLTSATLGLTVADVASPYFSNFGDFARRYRERFGERPSDTLQRAQRQRFRT